MDEMNNNIQENTLDKPINENGNSEPSQNDDDKVKIKFSIYRLMVWASLYFSLIIPAIGFALAAIGYSLALPNEKEEVFRISVISMGIAVFNFLIAIMENFI